MGLKGKPKENRSSWRCPNFKRTPDLNRCSFGGSLSIYRGAWWGTASRETGGHIPDLKEVPPPLHRYPVYRADGLNVPIQSVHERDSNVGGRLGLASAENVFFFKERFRIWRQAGSSPLAENAFFLISPRQAGSSANCFRTCSSYGSSTTAGLPS